MELIARLGRYPQPTTSNSLTIENSVVAFAFRGAREKLSGDFRLVDPATTCTPKEAALKLGQQDPKGDAGNSGLSEYEVIPASHPISGAGDWVFDAACHDGNTAISGGYTLPAGSANAESHPRDGDPTVLRLAFGVPGPTTITLYLQCARTQ